MAISHREPVAEDHAALAALAALAAALVDTPRATLKELATAAGVSRATLYRSYQTREKLIERLFTHAALVCTDALERAQLQTSPVRQGLRKFIENNLEHRELTAFLMYYWKDAPSDPCLDGSWDTALDAFFLRGQQEGVFRIDVSAPALTEILISLLTGLTDAERRGRVARHGLAGMVETVFLQGLEKS